MTLENTPKAICQMHTRESYVCMYVLYVWIACVYVCMSVCLSLSQCVCVCVWGREGVYVYVYLHICEHKYISITLLKAMNAL